MRTEAEQTNKPVLPQWELLRCPLCHAPFAARGGSLVCEHAHCFDVSAKGYVNLLPNQRQTNYTKAFFRARTAVFAAGYYRGIAQALGELIAAYGAGRVLRLLDAGCGEGSYCGYLQREMPGLHCFGMDIEKEGIRLAAGNAKGSTLFVGDLANIPLQDHTMDVLLNIFTPAHYAEFARVLKGEGLLVKVAPGPAHMRELREILGMQAEEGGAVEALFSRHCVLEQRIVCTHTYAVDDTGREQLLAMTPLLFDTRRQQAQGLDTLRAITIDGVLLVGKPKER